MDLRVLIIVLVFILLNFGCPTQSSPLFLLGHLYILFCRKIWVRLPRFLFLFLFWEPSLIAITAGAWELELLSEDSI